MFMSDKPRMKEEYCFPFETPASPSSKGFLQDFDHLDGDHDNQFHDNGSASNPYFGVQTGSNFDSFDAFPYGLPSDIHFYDYECKPFVGNISGGGGHGHGQVNENLQSGAYLNLSSQRSSIDEIGSNQGHVSLNFEEIKPVSFVVPDEVSCVSAAKNECNRKMGLNNTRALLPSARKTWIGPKKNSVVKGQWTIEEDRTLIQLVEQYGVRKWSHVAQMLPGRIGKQCRERWHNHLRPNIKVKELGSDFPISLPLFYKETWSVDEDKRKCRPKYPKASLLQDYIKSLNLDSGIAGRGLGISTTASTDIILGNDTKLKAPELQPRDLVLFKDYDNGLVPNYSFNEVPGFDIHEKIFQGGCSTVDSILDELPYDRFVAHDRRLEMKMPETDVNPFVGFEVKKEVDLVEMISQNKISTSSLFLFEHSMAAKSQKTATRREKFMKKINEGDKITRAMSFSKRQPTLKKKAEELKTLCAVTVCMVCYGPDGTVETYPENVEEVKKEIRSFKGLHAMQKREFNLLGYLESVKGKFELRRQKVRRKKLEALTESFSNQIEGLSGDDLLYFIEILEKKMVGLREKISLLSIDGEKGKAIAHDSNNMDHACDSTVPEPIEANNNIVRIENKSASSIVYEDLAEYFRDSELLKLAEFECQPITPDMRN
ncbi:hypothetical protein SADUNF_Sadunf15G0068900 [Salix dunnii]|uniref:Uncharacterized protein n=1 Tax=Salix dunnii TaxID=1413687 RepID=A0A835JB08_9ROSI|nr:hypothetical protein SADUNF_Sadunf15G0068900 [Salix dunnii]